QVGGIGAPADGEQQMRAGDFRAAFGAIDPRDNLLPAFRKTDALRLQPDVDAFPLEDILDGLRHVFVFIRDQPGTLFDNPNLAAKSPVHLPELQTDVASPYDHQAPGQEIDVHHGTVCEVWNLADAGQIGYYGPPPHVNEEPFRRESGLADAHFPRPFEAGAPLVHGAVFQVFE